MTDHSLKDTQAANPSASGPAGALFEGQVGAHYLLTLLAESDPRGLPGVTAERVELQRAGEGHPLDDVIVRGTTRTGLPAVLEVQVKRTIRFAPADSVFRDVVEQLARAFLTLDVSNLHHQFAVATERTSFKITGPYQDVLRWARELSSADTFIERINRKNVGNDDMRAFIATVRGHLGACGCTNDDMTVWQILRRFQILTFDYDAPGSQSLELATERCRDVLEPDEAPRASAFWKVLTESVIRSAASGGEFDRVKLVTELACVDGFRLRGTRRNRAPRQTLQNSSALAAEALRRDIGGATLARTAQLDIVRGSRDHGRYLEIRGGPGVGKSGILGMLVKEMLTEASAMVLTPERTPSGGWLVFKAALGLEGSPQEFLSDLASDGGAVLFIDSLDFFQDSGKKATVIDLVRSAVDVPSFQVIVTARTDFDKEEPNWLPAETLERLGRAPPITIGELGPEELEELRKAAPSLRALLSDDHPARSISQNLFRLSRLLEVQGSTQELRSEVDLIERWWKTGDGVSEGRRDRARLLADLSEQTLIGADHVVTRSLPATVESLIASETLVEIGLDRVSFRHDVLREWGVAAILSDDLSRLDNLPLSQAAAASLVRGVELGARFALERATDGQPWVEYLDRVSVAGSHPSWRRWSLLAILRSEIAPILLDRAATSLFENEGSLLGELIRTAKAVESRPFREMLAQAGITLPVSVPEGFYAAANPSWATLVYWLLNRKEELPLELVPDIVELLQNLGASMLFLDPLTPKMANVLADWLDEIDEARDFEVYTKGGPRSRFSGVFSYHDLEKLGDDMRRAFALMAARVPERAQSHLRSVLARTHNDSTIQNILRFRGMFAKVAPSELAELTRTGLVPSPSEDDDYEMSSRERIFTHLDLDFLPSSPGQGPFWDLLSEAPRTGLDLIRDLVNHALAKLKKGRTPGDGVTLVLPSGPRFFPWEKTYTWSRGTSGFHALESGLMALEAWAHARLDRGEAPEVVIADILGPDGSPAAFLLVAVDILISHWPKTVALAMPFLACPQLLSLDRDRQGHDALPGFDPLGLGALRRKEPMGVVRLADLNKRPSRSVPLDFLIGNFAHRDGADVSGLRDLLQLVAAQLGPPKPDDTFAAPRFMTCHALNKIDLANWHPADGGWVYRSPPDEEQHLAALHAEQASELQDLNISLAVQNALEDPSKSSAELAEQALLYAKRLENAPDNSEQNEIVDRRNAFSSAAMIVARDGSDRLLDAHEEWVRKVLNDTFADGRRDVGASQRDGIRYNPIAIAVVGLIHLWRRRGTDTDRDSLLHLAGRDTPEAAHGFGAALPVVRQLDGRMIPALLRCALQAQIRRSLRWDAPEEEKEADQVDFHRRVKDAIVAECAWLDGGTEPGWPVFPRNDIHVRRGIRIGDSANNRPASRRNHRKESMYTQSAALWLRLLTLDAVSNDLTWLPAFVDAYAEWTAEANGAGLERTADVDVRLNEWNNAFFSLFVRSMVSLDVGRAEAQTKHAIDVPDRSFYDILAELNPPIDISYLNGHGLSVSVVVKLREILADRLMQSTGWRREHDRTELSVEMRIGPAIAAMFFNEYNALTKSRCYLYAKGVALIDPFLPKLSELISTGPVPFTAMLTMNLLEVSPLARHMPFFLSSALVWLTRQPTNTDLWVEAGLGIRLAAWIEKIVSIDASQLATGNQLRAKIDDVLARLVRAGVPEAHRIERQIAQSFR
ncbi:conserved hypothetical protein (plasmid) [Rhizobium leguminosarum bv. trifolii WSM1325]|uniref:ATP-binding protein n=2 Tax=Rhizobium leguminosarum TaxID=384 RepID=C6B476_RHILS|nr:conserved hypothetical protein [Rhizobium leguminosarum bv. trifolii WSM1325]